MNFSKHTEAAVLEAYHTYWNAYLAGDMTSFAEILDDHCHIIGSTAHDVFNNKQDAVAFYAATAGQVAGIGEYRNRNITVIPQDENVMVQEIADYYFFSEAQWHFYGTARISTLFSNKTGAWKIVHQHGSLPDAKADKGQQFGTEKITQENLQLKEAIHRNTIDLNNKNRELEIEFSLEKVRAVAMGMMKPDDLLRICEVMYHELKKLGFAALRNAMINIHYEDEGYLLNYDYAENSGKTATRFQFNAHPIVEHLVNHARQSKEHFTEMVYSGEKLEDLRRFRQQNGEADDDRLDHVDALYYYFYTTGTGAVGISSFDAATDAQLNILKRFRNVFDLAYKRYTDITHAAAQAREAQIETALERVRSRSMAMQKSEELKEVIKVVYDQISQLNIRVDHAGFVVDYIPKGDWHFWIADKNEIPSRITHPYFKSVWATQFDEAKEKGRAFFITHLNFEEKNKFYEELLSYVPGLPEESIKFYLTCPGLAATTVVFDDVSLYIENFDAVPYTKEETNILLRFGKVFQQTYTRFLDLQKAEAQTREAQIEAALEKVRSRAMAMHNSEEIKEVVKTIVDKVGELHIDMNGGVSLATIVEGSKDLIHWYVNPDHLDEPKRMHLSYFPCKVFEDFNNARQNKQTLLSVVYNKQEKNEYFQTAFRKSEFSIIPAALKQWILDQEYFGYTVAIQKHAVIFFNDYTGKKFTAAENDTLLRFSNVFEQAYTRFLDLQKAEAQAKETQIQLALERVRARTMAMQASEEMPGVAALLFEQISTLGISTWTSGFNIWQDNDASFIGYNPSPTGGITPPYIIPSSEDPFFQKILQAKQQGKESIIFEWGDENLANTYQYMKSLPIIGDVLKGFEASGISLPTSQINYCIFFSQGFLLLITLEPYADALNIFKRFGNTFQQTYTRFLDLKQAEAQAKENQIQLALERVRARTMAMQHSDELRQVVHTIYEQLQTLDFNAQACNIVIADETTGDREFWVAGFTAELYPESYKVPYIHHPFVENEFKAWKKKEKYITYEYAGQDKKDFDRIFFSQTDFRNAPNEAKELMMVLESVKFSVAFFEHGSLQVLGPQYLSAPEAAILRRFAVVFEQTYTRFLDLQKAEEQAKENQIQLALERVRARTMAMQHSDEMGDAAGELFKQLNELLPNLWSCAFVLCEKDRQEDEWWFSADNEFIRGFYLPNVGDYAHASLYEGWLAGEDFRAVTLEGAKLQQHYDWLMGIDISRKIFEEMDANGIERPAYQQLHAAYFSKGYLAIITTEPTQQEAIFKRFAKVFDLVYTRFLDLQKAEAQARESQIQLALERVRARTMAMQHSNELPEAANLLFQQIQSLGMPTWSAGYNILSEDKKSSLCIMSSEGEIQKPFTLPLTEHESMLPWHEAIIRGDELFVYQQGGDELAEHYRYLNAIPELHIVLQELADAGLSLPTFQINHLAKFSHGFLLFITYEPVPEAHDIFKRFAKVFEQTYTRFLDLQKAEAQAREAQIEASLERVRSRAMAMHNSNDLSEATSRVFTELRNLGIEPIRSGVGIISKASKTLQIYSVVSGMEGKNISLIGSLVMEGHPEFENQFSYWEKKENYFVSLNGPGLQSYYRFLSTAINVNTNINYQEDHVEHGAWLMFSEGFLYAWSEKKYTEAEIGILERFKKIVELTFRRYFDLQKAEAQAREAQIETALEKVRSRTMAMQHSSELAETAAVLFQQLIQLGITPNRLYIAIVKDDTGVTEFWITDEDGSKINTAYSANLNDNATFTKMYNGWKQQQKLLVLDMKGEELQGYFRHLRSLGTPFKDGLEQKRRVQHIAYFGKGFIGMAAPEEQPVETLQLLERFAAVFNLTFTRFNDLKVAEAHALQAEQDLIEIKEARKNAEAALAELQATQKQLIQSEKMASLGELTAGIAHEIQNPLNFVNNFSEVNGELIEELINERSKEKTERDDALEEELLNDIKANEQKINTHGKRADAIVKGMLQHSRSSTGTKEPTDINALCDEYLRLSYHGLRAKDKSFNATLKTDFDQSIGNINIMPQDMGRVILNLINNAFYAVNEKKKKAGEDFQPTVSVSTKNVPGKVEIRVSDNGNGIAQEIVDKIFQPFFTTKPTGQGTGLGLSLSYDIVKAHGGALKVETKKGEGSTFIIQLTPN